MPNWQTFFHLLLTTSIGSFASPRLMHLWCLLCGSFSLPWDQWSGFTLFSNLKSTNRILQPVLVDQPPLHRQLLSYQFYRYLCWIDVVFGQWHAVLCNQSCNVGSIFFSACGSPHHGNRLTRQSFLDGCTFRCPLSRLTFLSYLMDPIILFLVIGGLQTPIHFTNTTVAVYMVSCTILPQH